MTIFLSQQYLPNGYLILWATKTQPFVNLPFVSHNIDCQWRGIKSKVLELCFNKNYNLVLTTILLGSPFLRPPVARFHCMFSLIFLIEIFPNNTCNRKRTAFSNGKQMIITVPNTYIILIKLAQSQPSRYDKWSCQKNSQNC